MNMIKEGYNLRNDIVSPQRAVERGMHGCGAIASPNRRNIVGFASLLLGRSGDPA
jgi:hypothetical protein